MKRDYTLSVWEDPDRVQQEINNWKSSLEFYKYESVFLENWLHDYVFQVMLTHEIEKAKQQKNNLRIFRDELKVCLIKLKKHHDQLYILLDSVDDHGKEKQFQKVHQDFLKKMQQLAINFRNLKRDVYTLIKEVLHHVQQKSLPQKGI